MEGNLYPNLSKTIGRNIYDKRNSVQVPILYVHHKYSLQDNSANGFGSTLHLPEEPSHQS